MPVPAHVTKLAEGSDVQFGGEGLRLVVEPRRVVTVGLAGIGHPELAVETPSPADVEHAKRLLLRLGAYVVAANAHLEPGDGFDLGGQRLTLADAGPGVWCPKTPSGPRTGVRAATVRTESGWLGGGAGLFDI